MNSFTVKNIKNINEIEEYLTSWNDLYNSDSFPISYSPYWLYSWLEAYIDDTIEINISFIYKNNKLVCVIPLMVRSDNVRTLKFLSDSCSDYLGILCIERFDSNLKKIFIDILTKINFDRFEFNNIKYSAWFIDFLTYLVSYNSVKIKHGNISHSITLSNSYDSHIKEIIKKRRFKRKFDGLDSLGNVSFAVYNKLDKKLFDTIFQIHMNKWLDDKVFPQFFDERRIKFLKEVSEKLSKYNKFIVFTLLLNNEVIAYRLGFIHNNIYFDWNTSFCKKFQKYSPGIVLTFRIINYLYKNGFSTFNFLNGDEKYKYLWKTNTDYLFNISGNKIQSSIQQPTVTPKIKQLKSKNCYIFDIDGVIFNGDKPNIETINAINYLIKNNYKVGILSNISSVPVSEINIKFNNHNLKINNSNIMTAGLALSNFILDSKYKDVFFIGDYNVFKEVFDRKKITVNKSSIKVDAVIVTFSTKFNYEQLKTASKYIKNGAEFICSDLDNGYMSEKAVLPGTGWITSSISSITKKQPFIIGKPNTYSLDLLLNNIDAVPKNSVIIGDNLSSDIQVAKKMNITSCLLLGGVSTLSDVKKLNSSNRPNFVINSLNEILNAIK